METKRRKRIEDMTPAERLAEAQRICDGSSYKIINGRKYFAINGNGEDYFRLLGAIPMEEFQWTR